MTEIIQTLQGTINRLKEDNQHSSVEIQKVSNARITLVKELTEYQTVEDYHTLRIFHNLTEIKKLEKYLHTLNEVAQWG